MIKAPLHSQAICLALFMIVFSTHMSRAQQVADTLYQPSIQSPAYDTAQGPVIFIDEGHNNFHTKNGRYKAFSNLLERDGYLVKEYKGTFSKDRLEQGKILVISNALNTLNVSNWYLPNPSAFTPEEISEVKEWVTNGGCLFLIADHMPMGGAAQDLALAFGFEFTNGFVFDTTNEGPAFFTPEEGSLVESVITRGRNADEGVSRIATFTGQAFNIHEEATPILILNDKYVNMMPDTAWVFNDDTRISSTQGMSQGAYRTFGKGKIVAFGEAAMFTAQLAGSQQFKMGMNNPTASENYQLLLNIIHWLDGKLEE